MTFEQGEVPVISCAVAVRDVIEFAFTVTVVLKLPNPSAIVVAATAPPHVELLYILTVAPGSVVPCTVGEALLDGDAGVVPVNTGAGGVAIVTYNADIS